MGRMSNLSDPSPVILITGASSGIGAATARLFGSCGYRVVLAARRQERLEEIAEKIQSGGGEALPVTVDLENCEAIQNLPRLVLMHYEQIDILFNNAGWGRLDWLENLDVKNDIEAQIQVNLLGVIEMTRAVLPHMLARQKGHIINMSSVAGWVATPTYSIYAASKFGIRGFTDALRREVGIYGIHVSGIYPGSVATEFSQHTGTKRKTRMRTPPALRLAPEQVAGAVLKLVQKPRRTVIIPASMNLAVWFGILFPGLADWFIERRFTHIERRK